MYQALLLVAIIVCCVYVEILLKNKSRANAFELIYNRSRDLKYLLNKE